MSVNYQDFKDKVLAENTVRSKTIELHRLDLVKYMERDMMSMVDNDGKTRTFHITDGALKQFLKAAGIEAGLVDFLSAGSGGKAIALVTKLIKSAVKNKGTKVRLVIDFATKTVIGVQEREIPYFAPEEFFKIFETTLTGRSEIKNASFENGTIKITAMSDQYGFKLPNLTDEEYNVGTTFTNGVLTGASVAPYFYRLICTNGMIGEGEMDSFKLRLEGTDVEKIRKFVTGIKSLSPESYDPTVFAERVRIMDNTKASFNELLSIKTKVLSECPSPKVLTANTLVLTDREVEEFFPTSHIYMAYSRKGLDLNEFTKNHLATIKTDMSCWELLNRLTDFGSHDYVALTHNSKLKLQAEAGRFMNKKVFDTNYLMPQLVF